MIYSCIPFRVIVLTSDVIYDLRSICDSAFAILIMIPFSNSRFDYDEKKLPRVVIFLDCTTSCENKKILFTKKQTPPLASFKIKVLELFSTKHGTLYSTNRQNGFHVKIIKSLKQSSSRFGKGGGGASIKLSALSTKPTSTESCIKLSLPFNLRSCDSRVGD